MVGYVLRPGPDNSHIGAAGATSVYSGAARRVALSPRPPGGSACGGSRCAARSRLGSRALDAAIAGIVKAVSKGDSVNLNGFGGFRAAKRAARTGRNPRTGEALLIPATTVPYFKASKARNTGAKFAAGTRFKAAVAGRPA